MHLHPVFIVAAMTLFAFLGGIGLKQFSGTHDILWLVAGFCFYGLSNVFFILTIDQSGLARSIVFGAAAQIILSSAAGFYLGERIGPAGWAAAALACFAVVAASLDRPGPSAPPASPSSELTEEADHADGKC